jgi:hypothetical protein
MKGNDFQELVHYVMMAITACEQEIGYKIYVNVATGITDDGKAYIRIEEDKADS